MTTEAPTVAALKAKAIEIHSHIDRLMHQYICLTRAEVVSRVDLKKKTAGLEPENAEMNRVDAKIENRNHVELVHGYSNLRSQLLLIQGELVYLRYSSLRSQLHLSRGEVVSRVHLKKKTTGLEPENAEMNRVLQLEEVKAKLHKQILERDAWMKEMDARKQKYSKFLAEQNAELEQQRGQIEGLSADTQRREKTLEDLKRADERTSPKNERAALLNMRDIISGISSNKPHWKEAFDALEKHYASSYGVEDAETGFVVVTRDDTDKKFDDVDKLEIFRKVRSFAEKIGTTPQILLLLWELYLDPERHSSNHSRVRDVKAMQELRTRAMETVKAVPARLRDAAQFAVSTYEEVIQAEGRACVPATEPHIAVQA
jgi:hypothetical protein